MTNDYYINLADYYTNQLTSGTPSETITLTEPYVSEDFDTYFLNQSSNVGGVGYEITGYLNWDKSKNLVMYGYFTDGGGSFYKSFIVRIPFINNNYDLTQAYCSTTYSGGTALPRFQELKVDTDGSVYGIANGGTTYMLLMIGNPFETNGIKYRQSYAIPSAYSSYVNYNRVIKKDNTGEYLIVLYDGASSTLLLHLTINVGASNTWEAFTYGYSVVVYDYYITWNNTIELYLLTGNRNSDNSLFDIVYFNGSAMNYYGSYSKGSAGSSFYNGAKFYNKNIIYYIVSNVDIDNSIATNRVYKLDITTNANTLIASSSLTYTTATPSALLLQMNRRQQTQIVNGLVCFSFFKSDGSGTGTNIFGVVANNNVYTLTSSLNISTTDLVTFFAKNLYNSYQILMPLKNYLDIVEFQYDSNGYNGVAYVDTDMLVPHRVELYNGSSKLLFNRDLYNLKVYSNVTEATVNVPNTMLNDDTIANSVLYGKTNYDLVSDNTSITKNIYENLMINFFNSIVVSDYTGRIYNNGGARVNDSISKTNDMNNASASKLKVFYSNNTTAVHLLPTPTITGSGNPMTIQYDTSIVVASLGSVLKYQILSNDEQTIYFEYDMSSVSPGIYQLSQECIVE